jgi:acyl-[acyl-carrier-protein]-phospholipid O-acyltransferase/long-chain-fatty-acid--[acyl-carrier-protein] ligase
LVYLEDLAKQISIADKVKGFCDWVLKKQPKKTAEKTAVVLFTSGSEGTPKAVFLSHKNLQANRYQIASIIPFNATDSVFNALPMFHSFGLSVGTILPLLFGVKVFLYPSPLHYRIVPELCYDTAATVIFGTDTFFAGYGKMANPYDFFALKYAVIGGEKLKTTTADLWMKKFGVRILEGYGTTETAPVLSINSPMHFREGTVGRLLPDIKYKLQKVNGIDEGGRLFVKGDNVMQGYMTSEKAGVLQPLADGWYDTGDIVKVDDEGYVTIEGRAKRFAKIGGEMVSLTAVEQLLDRLYPQCLQGILSVRDDKKGEQLVLMTNNSEADLSEIREFFKREGMSELWVPKKVLYVKDIPVLGSGKFDYVAAEKLL